MDLGRSKRQKKNVTRCGCDAFYRVHVHLYTGHWYVMLWNFGHNHLILEPLLFVLLPPHM